jgi:hypothetical protein
MYLIGNVVSEVTNVTELLESLEQLQLAEVCDIYDVPVHVALRLRNLATVVAIAPMIAPSKSSKLSMLRNQSINENMVSASNNSTTSTFDVSGVSASRMGVS